MNSRRFPLQQTKTTSACTIAWSLIAPYADQARSNHRQTLECLAERGGLSPVEAYFILNSSPYTRGQIDEQTALRWIREREASVTVVLPPPPPGSVLGLLERTTALADRLLTAEACEGIRNNPEEVATVAEAKAALAMLKNGI